MVCSWRSTRTRLLRPWARPGCVLAVEGAYQFVLGDGHWIAPFADVGGRLDGGRAATGWGMEVGGGLRYAHAAQHLTAEVHTRALLAHGADGFRTWSLSGSVRYDPSKISEAGPYFTLSSSRGLAEDRHPNSGIQTIADPLPIGGLAPGWEIDTELGYGISVLRGSATGTPWAGVSVSEGISSIGSGTASLSAPVCTWG